MRILRLDLKAFGPFSDLTLSPHDGKFGLHIVYGPNEAGKSSSLRALRQWLFGIDQQTSDNFLHPYSSLRIGGLIEDSEGNRLEFIRRKARVKSLRDANDDELIDEAVLDRMLGGIDAAAFSRRFGISYEELRRGGHQVAQGGGELGELLFAAGAGVADLGRLQQQLKEESESLFTPRGTTKKTINAAIAKYKEAIQQVKGQQVSTTAWKQLDQALRKAEKRRQEIDDDLVELRKQLSRLERVATALPLIGARRELLERSLEVEDAPLLPEDFAERRSKLTESLRHQEGNLQKAEDDIDSLSAEIDGITLPVAVLENSSRIEQVKDDLGAYRKAQKDRPGLMSKIELFEERALEILTELGKPADLKAAEELKVSKVQRQRIQQLVSRYQLVQKELQNARKNRSKLQRELQEQQDSLAGLPPLSDTASLRRAVREVTQEGNLDERRSVQQTELQQAEEHSLRELKKLPLWTGTLEDLEQLALPLAETIDQFEDADRECRNAVTQAHKDLKRLRDEQEKLGTEQQSLQLERSVPTESELHELRNRRDEGWKLISLVLNGAGECELTGAAEFVQTFAPGKTLAEAFHACVLQSDELSDRLRRESDRVVRVAQLQAELDSMERQIDTQSDTCSQADDQLQRHLLKWQQLWESVGIDPLTPREMNAWLRSAHELSSASRELRSLRQAVDATEEQIQTCRRQLQGALAEASVDAPAETDQLKSLLAYVNDRLEELETANRSRESCEKEIHRISRELANAEQTCADAAEAETSWQSDWGDAVAELNLDAASEPEVTSEQLQQIEELQQSIRDKDGMSRRIKDINRESQEFESQIHQLLTDVAPDLLDKPVDLAVQNLTSRLTTGKQDQVRKEGLEKQLSDAVDRSREAKRQVGLIQEQLNELCKLAGAATVSELAAAEQRSSTRAELNREVKEINNRLMDLAAGVPLEEFIASVDGSDIDEVRAEKERLRDTIDEREVERTTTVESIGENRNELQRMNGQANAAQAQEQVELLISETRDDAEKYVRLHLASVVLKQAIERYRESSQGPVLERAGRLFSQLTLNSFSGLRPDYNDKGDTVIVGIRGDGGQVVHVDGMSEGTCDQLYLSLRLALLEASLASGHCLPFILDDVLIMFDDERTTAALKVLEELSARTQVIYFTHHEHLLDLARDNLDSDTLFIHSLTGSST